MKKVSYIRSVKNIDELDEKTKAILEEVSQRYVFRANDYYLGLIDWRDPEDPIRKIVVPDADELKDWGQLDASNEEAVTVVRGVQHKYPHTVLLLVNEICGAYCRYCFRKRLFMDDTDETSLDISEGLEYIRHTPSITNVLLTGGDPLIMGTKKILSILQQVLDIPHVRIARIGSKMPAFNPYRIVDDPELVEGLARLSQPGKRIYLMAHFDHPKELTPVARQGLDMMIRAGVICINQNPLLRGINDDPETLAELYRELSAIGCPPYYLFQGRPTAGNEPYELPIVQGFQIFEEAKKMVSGLAKRARFCMSHETGKIEIVGIDQQHIYMRYHRAKNPKMEGRFMVFHRNDKAYWLDQLEPVENLGMDRSNSGSETGDLVPASYSNGRLI